MIQHFRCKLANQFRLFLSIAEEKVSIKFSCMKEQLWASADVAEEHLTELGL